MHKSIHIFIDPLIARLKGFVQRNPVFSIAVVAAFISSCIVHPDREYLHYFDWKTLTCLYCVLAVVGALGNIKFFTMLAYKIVKVFHTTRMSILALCYITFIGSMFIANDMALLTFLPLGYFVLTSTGKERLMAFTFIMQNIAANLGGMLTPFGNPQNLFLYSKFNIGNMEFMRIMFPPFMLSVILITICCLCVKSEPLSIKAPGMARHFRRLVIYLALFALSIVIVFRIVPYYYGLVIITLSLLYLDRAALKHVDYCLLCTFAAFFVFAGNMSRMVAVHRLFEWLLTKSTLVFSVLSCQIISNVPSAILLSQFTDNYRDLLVGVNIGGTGTLIASLASLITYSHYKRFNPAGLKGYLLLFAAFNAGFLAVLLGFMLLYH